MYFYRNLPVAYRAIANKNKKMNVINHMNIEIHRTRFFVRLLYLNIYRKGANVFNEN